jgi:HK97 family phage portal protein
MAAAGVRAFLEGLTGGLRSFWIGEIPSRDPMLAQYFGSPPVRSGVSVSESTALNYSAFWAAVQSIAGTVASLPLFLYRRLPNGGKERASASRLYRLLHDEFNPEMGSMVARETMQAHVLTWGNAYAEIERNQKGEPLRLWPLRPDLVRPERAPSGAVVYRVTSINGPDVLVPYEDMLHIPGLGWDGLYGYSVIRKARETIGLGLATEQFGALFFGNGGWPGIIAQHPGKLSQEAHKRLKDSLNEAVQGTKAHSLIVTEEGIKVEKVGIPPDDAQFLSTRQFQVTEIARWFNMPPHKLRDLSHATFSNIEEQNIDWVSDTLRPWLVRWEQELNRKLIRPLERNLQFTEHLVDGLMRGRTNERYAAYAVGRQWGWLSADDIRELENMNPLPDGQGQIYLVPLNMQSAEMAATPAAPPAPEPKSEPASPPEATPARDIRPNWTGHRAQLIAAHRGIVLEAVGRMIRKEANAARRAAKPGAAHLRQWIDEFYPDHTGMMTDALTPAFHAHLRHMESEADPRDAARDVALASVAQSRARLSALLVPSLPPDVLTQRVDLEVSRWELERPAWIADQILTEELVHALHG